MIKIRKIAFILLISLSVNVFSQQWVNIPNPSNISVQLILPVANNKITYWNSIQLSPSSGANFKGYLADDFASLQLIYSYSTGSGGSGNVVYANGISEDVVSVMGNYSYVPRVQSSRNGFVNSYSFSYGGAGDILSHFYNGRNLYCLGKISTDTLIFTNALSDSSQVLFTVKLPKYITNERVNENMTFINDSVGFILTKYKSNINKTVLLKTENYGSSWAEIHIDSINRMTSFSFPSNAIGYITKNNSSIYKTNDGGATWNLINTPTTFSITCVKFADNNVGYIGGPTGLLYKTINGGGSWSIEVTGTTANIKRLFTFGPFAYFETSSISNGLFKNLPKGVGITEYASNLQNVKIYPNPTSGSLTIDVEKDNSDKITISIKNLLGQEMYSFEDESGNLNFSKILDLTQLNNGIYIIKVTHSDKIYIQKIIVTH